MESLTELVRALVTLIEQLGVMGVFVMTFLESTFAPIPSEATMIWRSSRGCSSSRAFLTFASITVSSL